MARKPRKKSAASVKAAADRAESRSKGEEPKEEVTPLSPAESKPAGYVFGRPTKYDSSMCQTVVELGALGKSKAQIARALGISMATFQLYQKKHEDFSIAVKDARDLALAWWEERGQEGVSEGKDFNATAFIFQMKNRFRDDYCDKTEVKHDASEAFANLWQRIGGGTGGAP